MDHALTCFATVCITILCSLMYLLFAGYTQLKLLTKEILVDLLQRCVPSDWLSGVLVTWNPEAYGQPPSDWLEKVWMYLHHTNDLSSVQNLPIIPVSSTDSLTVLAPLGSNTTLICKVRIR